MDPSDVCQFIRLLLINLISDFQLSHKAEPKEFILRLSAISDNDWNHHSDTCRMRIGKFFETLNANIKCPR